MNIQEYLAAEGLNQEEITAFIGNDKQSKALTKALGLADEGRTAISAAQAKEAETAQFWETKTQELQGSVTKMTALERRAAQAEAEAARVRAYNKSLADAGYDIPKEMYEGAPSGPIPPKDPASGQFLSREDFDKGSRKTGADLVSLTKLSNEYSYLFGKPYLSVDEDYAEAQKLGKPLTEYAQTKHGFVAKRAEMAQKDADAAYQVRYQADLAKDKATWAQNNGSNPNTSAPMASKFDKLAKQEGFKSDSFKSPEGRDANRAARLSKFENFDFRGNRSVQ